MSRACSHSDLVLVCLNWVRRVPGPLRLLVGTCCPAVTKWTWIELVTTTIDYPRSESCLPQRV